MTGCGDKKIAKISRTCRSRFLWFLKLLALASCQLSLFTSLCKHREECQALQPDTSSKN